MLMYNCVELSEHKAMSMCVSHTSIQAIVAQHEVRLRVISSLLVKEEHRICCCEGGVVHVAGPDARLATPRCSLSKRARMELNYMCD